MMRVADVMSRALVTVRADSRVSEAEELAEARSIRHLLVLQGENLVGVLCVCDLRGASGSGPVSDCMSAPVHWISARADVKDAARMMRTLTVGCLPVMGRGRVLGIVTRRDLRRTELEHDVVFERICESCKSHHDVRDIGDTEGVVFCRICRERMGPPDLTEDLGEGD